MELNNSEYNPNYRIQFKIQILESYFCIFWITELQEGLILPAPPY